METWYLKEGVPLGLGAFLGWIIEFLRKRAEIHKLRAESVALAGEHLKSLQTARNAYNDAAAECGEHVSRLVKAMQTGAALTEIDAIREAACSAVLNRCIPRFLDYSEWEKLDCHADRQRFQRFVEGHIVPELGRLARWLRVFNSPKFLTALGNKAPAKVSERNLEPFRRMIEAVPAKNSGVCVAKIDKAIREIVSA